MNVEIVIKNLINMTDFLIIRIFPVIKRNSFVTNKQNLSENQFSNN